MRCNQFTCLCPCCSPPEGCPRTRSSQRGLEQSWTSRGETRCGEPSPDWTENIVIHRLPLDIWTIFVETYVPLIIWNLILGRRKNRHFTARLTEERGLPPKPKHKHFMNIFDAFPFNFVEWHSFFLFFCHVKDCLSKTAPSFLATPRHTWSRRCHIWRPVHYRAIPLFTPSRISFTSHSFLLYPSWLPNLIISGVF